MPQALTRRDFFAKASAAAATTLALPAIAQSRRDFVVATYGGLFEKILREQVIPDFEREHPVNVKLELGVGTTFIPKMLASRRRSPYDVVYLNDDEALLGQGLDLWAPDQSAKLKNIGAVYDVLKPPAVPLYGAIIHEFVLVYNPAKLKDPTSWSDLWRPGLSVAVPHISNSYGITFILIAALLNGGDASNLDPGFAALKRLSNMKIYKGVTQGFTMFQQGEVDAAMFHLSRAQLLRGQGIDVAWAVPKEGSWGTRTGTQIPKAASDVALSAAWVDVALSPPYQAAFLGELYSPSNREVKLPEATQKLVTDPARLAQIKFPPWDVINPQRDALSARWVREFAA